METRCQECPTTLDPKKEEDPRQYGNNKWTHTHTHLKSITSFPSPQSTFQVRWFRQTPSLEFSENPHSKTKFRFRGFRYMFRSYGHLQMGIYTSKMLIIYIYIHFRCTYFHMKMVVRPKHVADNLNNIVNNYWNRVTLDGNLWTWSNTCNRMQTPKFKTKFVEMSFHTHTLLCMRVS
jgi:hypothetical protein